MSDNGTVSSPCLDGLSPSAETGRIRLGRVILSRPVGALAGAATVLIILGCMSLSFGGLSIGCKTEPDGTVCQEGKVSMHQGQELDVYYPVPYTSPPNLVLNGDADKCEIVEQKADHFRIRCKDPYDATPHWQARGLRCPPAAITPTVIVNPPVPPPVPPPTNNSPVPLPVPIPVQTP
ncbi:MAG TPA: hypothetical protein VH682_29455 [Gemmataceae bacterium]|jgi:hypothetical protein